MALLLAVSICAGAASRIAAADELDPTKPTASFTYAPGSPLSGTSVTFTSTSQPGILASPIQSEEWDLDNDGQYNDASGTEVQHSFATPGPHTVGLLVTDSLGGTSTTSATVDVQNRLPKAGFTSSPGSPSTLQTVTFTSDSSDADGSIVSYAWDLNNDGVFDDGNGSEAQSSFLFAGTYTVRLMVTDDSGGSDVVEHTVDVGNQGPVASFGYAPGTPSTGDQITFTSTSSDADGSIASYSWDLDGDNQFGDATTAQAQQTFSTPGDHKVQLRVTDNDGAIDTTSVLVNVANRAPTAGFDISPPNPKTGDQVDFTSTSSDSDGSIASYAWDLDNDGNFDDGTGSSAHTTFATKGPYTVRLEVTDNNGDSAVATNTIDVGNSPPTAAFGVSPASPATGEAVTLTSTSSDSDGSIAAYSWDLDGDGNFGDATASQVQKAFSTPGPHTVRLQVTDDSGASDIAVKTINASNRAPTAAFDYSPQSPNTGDQVTLTSTSSDPDGSIATIAWDLNNDGNFTDGSSAQVQTSFATPGPHPVKLRVTDDNGATDTTALTIEVANQAPTASFTISPQGGVLTGDQVDFTSTSGDPDGSIASYAWDLDNNGSFNDGSGQVAHKIFSTAGTYTVRLRVTDNNNAATVATDTVTIANRAPKASFTSLPASPKTGDTVSFGSTSTDIDGSIASYSWDLDGNGTFGDSLSASAQTAFAVPGPHTVSLMVTDNNGATDTAQNTITVTNQLPTSSFNVSSASPKTLEPVTFTSTSTDPENRLQSLAWDLDNDGQFNDGAGNEVQKAFPIAGTYTVKLLATDQDGGSAVSTKNVTVANQVPTASFDFAPVTPQTGEPVTFTSTSTDPESRLATTRWDLNNDGNFDDGNASQAQRAFDVAGTYTVGLEVTDQDGGTNVATKTVTVANRLPTATLDHDPKGPTTGQNITFTANAADPENRIKSLTWDSDNDGQFDDGSGTTLTRQFKKPGAYTVRFQIEDQDGGKAVAEDTVAVGNQAPKASFVVLPASPVAGSTFSLVSTSLDPDTPLDKWLWDLNGDGTYGDAQGPEVRYSIPTPGSYTIGLRVVDSEEVPDTITQQVVVQAPPPPSIAAPAAAPTGPSYRLLSPFPVVRLAGQINSKGTKLRLFVIEAPSGARVLVSCRGQSCPFRLSARSAAPQTDGKGQVRASTSLRIRPLERRLLKNGVTLSIFITKPGMVGKYVQFKIRKRRAPQRIDRCLLPGAPNKPVQCPS